MTIRSREILRCIEVPAFPHARLRLRAAARGVALLVLLCTAVLAGPVRGAPMLLNEFNAVASGEYLNGGTASTDGDGNSVDPPGDTTFGRIAGNGGDWMEFVVVADHLDIRGWKLVICDQAVCDQELVFSNHAVWSDLRAGTILTVSEDQPDDFSFDPGSGDWWINVRAHNGGSGTYITADNFPVSHDEWRMHIEDAAGHRVFGPIGEHVPQDPAAGCLPPQDDVNSGEIFRLEQDPSALVDPCRVSLNDWEDGVISTFGSPNQWNSGSASQSFAQLRALAPYPDSDGDLIPDDGDFSGIAGDNPCTGGVTSGCDDNCGAIQNASQADTGGPGGPDGQGDVCQCGDPSFDDDVTGADLSEVRELLVGLRSEVTEPERCSVISDGGCTLADAVVLARTLQNPTLSPGLAPACVAAEIPDDTSDIVFDEDRLIRVEIRISQTDWDLLRNEELDVIGELGSPSCGLEPWTDPYTFYPSEVSVDGKVFQNVGVRKKGFFGSLSTTQPSFKVKFDEFVGGQQWNGMDRLTLNNNKQDPAHVKQCVTYDLMRKAGVPAPRCNFADVTLIVVNGMNETTEFRDVYTNVESIKDPFLRRNFGSDGGKLYEGTLSDFWSGSYRNTIEPKNVAAAADWTEVDALVSALESNMTAAQRLAAIEALVDVDSFLTFWAMEGLTGHWDGYTGDQNNFWFYVNPADGLIHFIPWGTDDTLGQGNVLPGREGDPVHAAAIEPRAALPRRLYQMPAMQAAFLARLQLLLDDVFDEAEVHAEIDRIEALITPVAGNLTSPLAPIRTWVDEHRARVQAEIDSPINWTDGQPSHFCFFNP